MTRVVIGRANKQVAAELNVSEMTVKVHRGQVMRKMRARSLPELVRMGDQLSGTFCNVAGNFHQSRSLFSVNTYSESTLDLNEIN